jgi:hypothetical protein
MTANVNIAVWGAGNTEAIDTAAGGLHDISEQDLVAGTVVTLTNGNYVVGHRRGRTRAPEG